MCRGLVVLHLAHLILGALDIASQAEMALLHSWVSVAAGFVASRLQGPGCCSLAPRPGWWRARTLHAVCYCRRYSCNR